MGNSTFKQSHVGHFARMPHQHKILLAASLVAFTVPATTLAFYGRADSTAAVEVTKHALTPLPDAPGAEPTQPSPARPGEPDVKEDSKTIVTINGQQVSVPANGSYDKTTVNGNNTSEVHVQSSQNLNGTSASISVESHSSSTGGSVPQ
ncbi:MAG: hypothetical protein JWP85_2813 [Rhodoglobus sp.]|nr:hypothetical protein [Rhodoglobus sp.]